VSVALTDLLIELSDPKGLVLFQQDPETFMSGFALTEADREALGSRDRSRIRSCATSVETWDRANPPPRFHGPRRPSGEVAPCIYDATVIAEQDMIALEGKDLLFVDEVGQLCQGVPDSK
jgi:hypothetical protein